MMPAIESFQRQAAFVLRLPSKAAFSLQYKSDSTADQGAETNASPRRIVHSKSSHLDSQSAEQSTAPKLKASSSLSDGSARYFDLEAIKDSVDIVSVAESFDLDRFERKSLNRATAICPFHDDHNPSLSIDGQRGLYKCFSCGAGGDVFGFVRAIHKVQSGDDPSFIESVKFVQTEFDAVDARTSGIRGPDAGTSRPRTETKEMIQKKKRIHFANALAATFYVGFLTHPTAGGARQYLTETRLFPPAVIRRFSIGYAPDSYFGVQRQKDGWGKSGLVEHLRLQNFTAQECVEAGLAVVIQSKQKRKPSLKDKDSGTEDDEITFESIMDRFRGRIVVPILDKSGKNIVAFGGRKLPGFADQQDDQKYEGPKYLNSPETLAFRKQGVLFGHHLADAEKFRSLLVVEGYLDVVSLASVGVSNVVASMGTAISSDQLELAALTSDRVILCMDNDSAGKMAVERLCRDGKLASITRKFPTTQFCVATVPEGLKDPAELVESFLPDKDSEAKEMVQSELIQQAEPWTHWFVKRILESLDNVPADDKDSATNDIFHELASLISENSQNQQEIARLAATSLANAMAPGSVESLGPQLEIDLLDLASRMQTTRNLTSHNGESSGTIYKGRVPGIPDSEKFARRQSTKSHSDSQKNREGRVDDLSEEEKFSAKSKRNSNLGLSGKTSPWELPDDINLYQDSEIPLPLASFDESGKMELKGKRRKKAKMKRRSKESLDPKLTPHFAGFQFRQKSDLEWLQTTDGGRGRTGLDGTHVPVVPPSNSIKSRYQQRPRRPVYFNSNEYHGRQFITQDAVEAGYAPNPVQTRDPSIFQRGVSSLLKPDADAITTHSENALLRQLILNPAARSFMKNWIQARTVIKSSSSDINWSCSEKEWLMNCLVEDPEVASVQANEPSLVLQALLARNDTLEEAIVEPNCTDSEGMLNHLFQEMTPSEKSFFPKTSAQVEYYLQDLLGGLLWVAARKELENIQSDLLGLSQKLEQTFPSSDNQEIALVKEQSHEVVADNDSLSTATSNETILHEFQDRVKRMEQLTQRLCSIEEMRRRTSSRALDANNALKVEGRISSTLRDKLCSDFEDFVLSMSHTDASWELGPNEEPYETALERMDSQWGEWAEEGYMWSPSDADKVKTPIPDDPDMDDYKDDEESLAASLDRIDHDWAEWL